MKIAPKLIIAAILSLSIGIAAATPLLVNELNIVPYPRMPEGPKAISPVDIVYAKYDVQEHASTWSSGGIPLSIVNYDIVLNVTNVSDFPATIGQITFMTAENITVTRSLSGGMSMSSGGASPSGGGNAFLDGIWLDDQWLNVTWLPDGQWPIFGYGPNDKITKTIPPLPENATVNGTWIEGVHLFEYSSGAPHNSEIDSTSTQYLFVNGTWVDVTGRIRANILQPYVMATNTTLMQMVHFESEDIGHYANQAEFNEANPPESTFSGMKTLWAGEGGFNNTLQPHESKLIHLYGVWHVGADAGLESMAAGKISLYAAVSTYIKDYETRTTNYAYTYSTETYVNQVPVTKTATGYLYNAMLGEDRMFQYDQFGVEAFVVPRS